MISFVVSLSLFLILMILNFSGFSFAILDISLKILRTSFYFEEYLHLKRSETLKVTKLYGEGQYYLKVYIYLKHNLETQVKPSMSRFR